MRRPVALAGFAALLLALSFLLFLAASSPNAPPSIRTLRQIHGKNDQDVTSGAPILLPGFATATAALNSALATELGLKDASFLPLEGNSHQVIEQTVFYATLVASNAWIKRVCETGFNAGWYFNTARSDLPFF